MQAYGVDYEFTDLLQIPLTAGRGFSRTHADSQSFILSETAVKQLNWENPLGKQLQVGERTGTVIGIAKDYLFADIGFRIPPTVLYLEPEDLNFLLLRYSSPDGFLPLQKFIKAQWGSVFPDVPFECRTLDDYFNDFFLLLGRLANFLNAVGIAAVFFSSLGLLGLATYLVEQRTKEIGIRKALGAKRPAILLQFLMEAIVLCNIGGVIGVLVGFGLGNIVTLFTDFAIHVPMEWAIRGVIFCSVVGLVFGMWPAFRASRLAPIDALRYE